MEDHDLATGSGDQAPPLGRGALGMPKPQGWPIERIVDIMAGAGILATLGLARKRSARWRVLTGFIATNLLLDGAIGWCPFSMLLHRLGVPSAAERATGRG